MKTLTIKILSVLVITILSINIIPANSIYESKPLSEVKQQSSLWISENTYQVKPGTVEIYSGSMAFLNSTGQYEKINTTIQQNSTHYYGIKGIYKFYISKNLNISYPFIISRGNSSLLWKPVNAGYLDKSNYKIQVLRNLNLSSKPEVNGSSILYSQLFGRNIDFKITVGTDEFKEELLVSQALISSLPSPSNYGMLPENTFVGVISNYVKLNLNFSDNNIISQNYSTINTRLLNYKGVFKFGLPPSQAWDNQVDKMGNHNNTINVRNIFTLRSGVNKIGSGVPYNWLKNTIGEVIIDPTVTIQPSNQDVEIYEHLPDTNFNSYNHIDVRTSAGANYILRDLIDFTWSISGTYTVSSAVLSLRYYNHAPADPVGRYYHVHALIGAGATGWNETTATWNKYNGVNSWTTAGGDYSNTNNTYSRVPATTNIWQNWTVTKLIQGYKTNGSSTAHLLIKDGNETDATDYQSQYYSREYAVDTTLRPKLTITYSNIFYLTVYLHTGIGTLYLNGTSKANGTSTGYISGHIANITSVASAGHGFLYYKFNSTYFTTSNPLYWTMNKNYTVDAYAYAIVTTTVTSTTTLTTTVTSTTTITSTITTTTTSTTTSTSTITSTTILQNIVCANTTTTTTRSYVFFDGFESGNFVKWNNTANANTGQISVTSVKPINGSYSEHVSIGNNINGYGYAVGKTNLTSLGNNIWMQLFIRVDNFTHTPNKEFHFLSLRNTTSGSAGAFIRMGIKHLSGMGEHILEVEVNSPSGSKDYETGDLDILNNSVTRIELGLFKNATNGYVEAFVNGSRVINLQHIKTDYPAFTLNNFRVGVTATGNGMKDFNVTIDNVAFDGSRIGLPPFTCIYITNTFTTGIQVLPNNEIPNLFYFGVLGGIILIFLFIAVLARRRN